ncbi:MAG: hypothetical protein LBK58_10465, partial [Prevotellaceae bacterium]|nr:hypothetical protein [Prevotellaceae bacterium]
TPELRSSSTPYGVVTERSFTPNCTCGLFGVIHLKLLTEFVRNAQNCPAHCIIRICLNISTKIPKGCHYYSKTTNTNLTKRRRRDIIVIHKMERI